MNFRKNLYDLITDAHFFQYADINDTKDDIVKKKPRLFFTKVQWLLIFISFVIALSIEKGFSESFAGYIISGLSLFVGLFFTFLITLYDKFKNIDFSLYHISVNEEKYVVGVRLKNFFKKVSVLSLYSVLISISSIILLSITLLFPEINFEIHPFAFIIKICEQDFITILKVFFVMIYRTTVLYFLFDFILITIYIISSFYDFIISEYNKVKLS